MQRLSGLKFKQPGRRRPPESGLNAERNQRKGDWSASSLDDYCDGPDDGRAFAGDA